jgi:hypothetical protein
VATLGPLAVDGRVFAVVALFAVANTALINMIMASRQTYRPSSTPTTADHGAAGSHELTRRTCQGLSKTACVPTRRQRIAGSPSTSIHCQVARPSGSFQLHVISHTPEAPSMCFTRSELCQGADSPAAAFTAES